MISSISSSQSLQYVQPVINTAKPPATSTADKPDTLPANPPSTKVTISDEAKKLLAARTLQSSPVALAAASDNQQVDQAAQAVYQAQLKQQQINIYTDVSQSGNGGVIGNDNDNNGAKAVAVAAASDNPQVDQAAQAVYQAQLKQQQIDIYTNVGQSDDAGDTGNDNDNVDKAAKAVAASALSDNEKVDDLATTYAKAVQAQQLIDTYTGVTQNNPYGSLT